jgi:hypothetical protein
MASALAATELTPPSARTCLPQCQQFLFRVYKNEPYVILNSYFVRRSDIRRNQRELTHINTGQAIAQYLIERRSTNQEASRCC